MRIRLTYHKLIKVEKYENNSIIEVPDKLTVRAFLALLEIPKNRLESMIVCVNNQPVWNTAVLKEGDSIKLLTVIAGG